jgi:hypothetical protein
MSQFQDSQATIRITNGEQTFVCPSAEFPTYEPAYEVLTAPMVLRVWTPQRAWRSDGCNDYPDCHDCSGYIAKIAAYQAAYDAAHVPAPVPLATQQAARKEQLKAEIKQYILAQYDENTQNSMLSVFLTTTDQTKKDTIKTVWGWVKGILQYYHSTRDAILSTTTEAELAAITWDVATSFDARDPGVSLEDLF